MRRLTLCVLLLLLTTTPALAQDEGELACTAEDLAATIADARELLDQTEALVEESPEEALAALTEARAMLALNDAACRGLSFGDDNRAVIGPVNIPAGMYRVTMTTDGFGAAFMIPVDGDCGPRGYGDLLFNLSAGEGKGGAEALATSEGCRTLIETDNITAPWTLTFELIE